jgi:hypothetical protein
MTERRPIQKTRDKSGRESYANEKLEWLLQVARDPAAEYGARLAIVLAVAHLKNDTGVCIPGDDKLAAAIGMSTKTVQRMRNLLIERKHLKHELCQTGRPRDESKSTYTLLLDPPTTSGQHAVHQSDPTSGQISPDLWTEKARPLDNKKCQVIDPSSKSVPNQGNQGNQEGRRHHHHEKTANRKAPALVDLLNERAAAVAKKYGYD